eukprot:7376987-Prymnesium_polylepis.1
MANTARARGTAMHNARAQPPTPQTRPGPGAPHTVRPHAATAREPRAPTAVWRVAQRVAQRVEKPQRTATVRLNIGKACFGLSFHLAVAHLRLFDLPRLKLPTRSADHSSKCARRLSAQPRPSCAARLPPNRATPRP